MDFGKIGGGAFSNAGGGTQGKTKRDQMLEEKRRAKDLSGGGAISNQTSTFIMPTAPPSGFQSNDRFLSPPQKFRDFQSGSQPVAQNFETSTNGSFSSPGSKKKKKRVMFALPAEELQKEKQKFELPIQNSNYQPQQQQFSQFQRNEDSNDEDDFQRATFDHEMLNIDKAGPRNSQLTSKNIQFIHPNNMASSQQWGNDEKQSQLNESQLSDSQSSIPKYSPVKRNNPNRKYVPTGQFVSGEGTAGDLRDMPNLIEKSTKEKSYQQELLQQMDEKRRKREEEKRKLKEDEIKEEERVRRELMEMQRKEQMEKDNKKQRLGDIMERYHSEIGSRAQSSNLPIMIKDENNPGTQYPRPIQVEMPEGAQYAQYRSSDENDYDYTKDFEKFDVLNRGHRAAMSGVPRAKMISDIGHDLKRSIQNEVQKIRGAIQVQNNDFRDQLDKLTVEAKIAIDERDKVKNHLYILQREVRRKREEQMMQEKTLMKALNKYQLEPQKYHYPQRHIHLETTTAKPEERKTVYEKIFFDKIENVIEAEKLNPPLSLYREATQNPKAQITIGKDQYYANSKGALNCESSLVTLDNKQLYPSKSLYELPQLQVKSEIVDWKREPYEYYNNRVKELNPRNEMYIVKNNYESKYASRISDELNQQRYNLPEREEHRPQYNSRIRPIDLASINVEKLHQVNELRLTKLDEDRYLSIPAPKLDSKKTKYGTDLEAIEEILNMKLD